MGGVHFGALGVRRVCGPVVSRRRGEGSGAHAAARDHRRHARHHRRLPDDQRRVSLRAADRHGREVAAHRRGYDGRAHRPRRCQLRLDCRRHLHLRGGELGSARRAAHLLRGR